jgi:shikimate kinase
VSISSTGLFLFREKNMKLVFLFGDAAVGKMTVGQELTKITDLKII